MSTNECAKCGAPRPCTYHDEAVKPSGIAGICSGVRKDWVEITLPGTVTETTIDAVFEADTTDDEDDCLNGMYNIRLYDTTGRLHDTQKAWFERNTNVDTIAFRTNDRNCTYDRAEIGKIGCARFKPTPAGIGDYLLFYPGDLKITITVS